MKATKEKPFNIKEYNPSFSFLKNLNEWSGSPALALHEKLNRKKTKALSFGKLLDIAVLDPDRFDKEYKVLPEGVNPDSQDYRFAETLIYLFSMDRRERSNERLAEMAKRITHHSYKASTCLDKFHNGQWHSIKKSIQLTKSGKGVKKSDYDMVCRMRDKALGKNSPLPDYLQGAELHKWVEWKNKASGIHCRGEVDALGGSYLLDLKSTAEETPSRNTINRILRKWFMPSQMAAYQEATGATDCFLFLISKSPLHQFQMVRVREQDLEKGLQMFNTWCLRFKHIQSQNLWDMGPEYFEMYERDNPTGVIDSNCYGF